MSIPDHNLTKEEETLHHYAAMLEKRLEAYHACESRDENTWANEFKVFLARSMMYFTDAIHRSRIHPRMHPLFLSLTEVISESGNAPDISSVSENDPRALRSNYYTAPSDLPLLDIHFNGQNVCNLENVLSQCKELSVEATDATVNIPRNVEKHYGAPSDKCKVVTRSAAKRKVAEQVETTAASASKGNAGDDENMILPELEVERHPGYKTNTEERQLRKQAKGKDNDKTFKDLKLEVQALTVRCNEYERIIKDLQSARDTHKNILEMLRQQIVDLHDSRGTLSSAYGGKNYDLIS
ncbi:hypothetical protein EI94DRAFT_1701998 [Lactarius quietus]|nr:hypothetical protein EI94DRAFT_1701998 [Lactarius quietus]